MRKSLFQVVSLLRPEVVNLVRLMVVSFYRLMVVSFYRLVVVNLPGFSTWGENHINIAKEGIFLSAAGRVQEFLCKLPITYPLKISDQNADPDMVIQAAWDIQRSKFTIVLLNFSDTTKLCKVDISDLNKKFSKQQRHLLVYANDSKDFNSPVDRNKIKSIDDLSNLSGSKIDFKLRPYSANAWIFSVKEQ